MSFIRILAACLLCLAFSLLSLFGNSYGETGYLTFDNQPLGSVRRPLILRTFVPSMGVSPKQVLANHSHGLASPKYSPSSGKEADDAYDPIDGVPASISVNLGKKLSFVWDTTECRLLYAWTDGFLDMKNYWGDRLGGRRKGFGYVPRLYGFLFYRATGEHPIRINGRSIAQIGSPRYLGYSLGEDRLPSFDLEVGPHELSVGIRPGSSPQTLLLELSSKGEESLDFRSPKTQVKVMKNKPGALSVEIRPNAGERFSSEEKTVSIAKPTREIGEKLYVSLGCIACHSLDGGKNHGPTLKAIHGSRREFLDGESLIVDDAYLRESIEKPMAKTVKGYLTGMMPPYQLQQAEYDSLILFINSVP